MLVTLFDLPNETLLHVLTLLPTICLAPVSAVSHRLYALACRVFYNRLQVASQLPEHTLLLECYHPSATRMEPPFYCTYLGTNGLDTGHIELDGDFTSMNMPVGRMSDYRKLYSVYRPQRRPPDEQARRVRHPAGDVPGSRTHPSSATSWMEEAALGDVVRQRLTLDTNELFTQLIASLHVARSGPRRGLFFSFVDVCEGVVRVWRDWLGAVATVAGELQGADASFSSYDVKEAIKDSTILWVDTAKRVGLRLQVRERQERPLQAPPDPSNMNEELPVSYDIEYQELIVRTSHLIFTLEASLVQQDDSAGKAVVFGTFE